MTHLRSAGIGLCALLAVSVQAGQLTVEEVKGVQKRVQSGEFNGRAQWNALTYYLQGVIEGAASYHEGLRKEKKALFFCPPQKKGYSVDEMLKILHEAPQSDSNRPAATVILEGYKRKYPCKE